MKILFYVNSLKTRRRKKYPSPKWTFETLLELKIYTCTTIPYTIHEHAHTEVLHYSPFSSWPDMQVVEGHRGCILWFPDLSFFMQTFLQYDNISRDLFCLSDIYWVLFYFVFMVSKH